VAWTEQLTQLLGQPSEIVFTMFRVILVYGFLLLALRFTGRRQLGQLTSFDLVTLLLLSNVVQNAMVGMDSSLTGGMLGAFILLLLNYGLSRSRLRATFEGKPIVLVSHGKVEEGAVRREGISKDELEEALREHGVRSLEDTEMAVLEANGAISVIAKSDPVRKLRKVKSNRNR
jgi:uncharacterized membrane protein YcaP (DUF421 family)